MRPTGSTTEPPPTLPVMASTCPPGKSCYKGITITPGGFLALETVYRDRFVGADMGTPFGIIPFNNVRAAHADEFRFSARQSRISGLVEGAVDSDTKLSGYAEFDFLSAAQTANLNESDSFTPRVRHLYAQVDRSDLGLHILAGQTWSLATMFTTGLQPRSENIPVTIDNQYVPGFVWTRQPQIRVVKDLAPDLQAGLSFENAQTIASGTLPSDFTYNAAPVAGGAFNSGNNISINHVPDIVAKVAWDPQIGERHIHLEAFGAGRDFYARANNRDEDVFAGFGGGSILVPLWPELVDAQFSGAVGQGIGRYGTSQLPDIAVGPTGQIHPLSEFALLAGVTVHATPTLDVYAYAGEEQVDRASLGSSSGVNYGFGNPANPNAGCNIEGSTLACTGNTRQVRQATIGLWNKFYSGGFGQLRGGIQYSYTEKTAFSADVGGAPKVNENIVLTSLRYYPF